MFGRIDEKVSLDPFLTGVEQVTGPLANRLRRLSPDYRSCVECRRQVRPFGPLQWNRHDPCQASMFFKIRSTNLNYRASWMERIRRGRSATGDERR